MVSCDVAPFGCTTTGVSGIELIRRINMHGTKDASNYSGSIYAICKTFAAASAIVCIEINGAGRNIIITNTYQMIPQERKSTEFVTQVIKAGTQRESLSVDFRL